MMYRDMSINCWYHAGQQLHQNARATNSLYGTSQHCSLEDAEAEVAALLAVGASDEETARECGITLDGAEARVRRLCERIDAHGHAAVGLVL